MPALKQTLPTLKNTVLEVKDPDIPLMLFVRAPQFEPSLDEEDALVVDMRIERYARLSALPKDLADQVSASLRSQLIKEEKPT
jgi:hypothetical protein